MLLINPSGENLTRFQLVQPHVCKQLSNQKGTIPGGSWPIILNYSLRGSFSLSSFIESYMLSRTDPDQHVSPGSSGFQCFLPSFMADTQLECAVKWSEALQKSVLFLNYHKVNQIRFWLNLLACRLFLPLEEYGQRCEVYRKAAGYPNSIRKDIRETNQPKTTEPLKWPGSHIRTHGITPAGSCI